MPRPRSKNVIRDKSGKSRGEPVEIIKATVWAQRAREGVRNDFVDDPLAGYCLGRLMLAGRQKDVAGISEEQYNAGWDFAKLVRRHASLMGYALGPKSPSLGGTGGLSTRIEPEEELIFKIRGKYNDCYHALMDAGQQILAGPYVARHTSDVCLDRIQFSELLGNPKMLGNVKIGLNALSRVLR